MRASVIWAECRGIREQAKGLLGADARLGCSALCISGPLGPGPDAGFGPQTSLLPSWHSVSSWAIKRHLQFTQRAAQFMHYIRRTRRESSNTISEILGQKVPGQKDMFAQVLLKVPGQMPHCPCGFSAYVRHLTEKKSPTNLTKAAKDARLASIFKLVIQNPFQSCWSFLN